MLMNPTKFSKLRVMRSISTKNDNFLHESVVFLEINGNTAVHYSLRRKLGVLAKTHFMCPRGGGGRVTDLGLSPDKKFDTFPKLNKKFCRVKKRAPSREKIRNSYLC